MYTIQKIEQDVLRAMKGALGKRYTPMVGELTAPPDPKWGDITFPCFSIAKGLGKPPAEVAAEVAPKISPGGFIARVESRGPYINFFLDPKVVARNTLREVELLGEKYGRATVGKKKQVMVEYGQLNTHKVTHIGHVRNLVLGQSIANILTAIGYRVITAGFHGDVGTHVATTLWGITKFHAREKPPAVGRGLWLNTIYTEATKRIEEHPREKAEMLELARKFEAGDRVTAKLWKQTREWSVRELDEVFGELGVQLAARYYESTMDEPGRCMVADLIERGIAKKSEGAIVVPLDEFGLPPFLVLKSDGSTLYATRDLALAKQKFKDYKLDRSIHIVDSRQSLHFEQLFKTLALLGFKKPMQHVPYEFVTLRDGALSSRKGNIVSYKTFRDQLLAVAGRETMKRHPDWSKTKREKVAREISMAALKFAMLAPDVSRPIVFDITAAISFDGATGPYIQYTGARISSLERKGRKFLPSRSVVPPITNDYEKRLLYSVARFPQVVQVAGQEMRPAPLASYLFDLAKTFSEFYEQVPVLTSESRERTFRLELARAVRTVLENGAALLGFTIPREM